MRLDKDRTTLVIKDLRDQPLADLFLVFQTPFGQCNVVRVTGITMSDTLVVGYRGDHENEDGTKGTTVACFPITCGWYLVNADVTEVVTYEDTMRLERLNFPYRIQLQQGFEKLKNSVESGDYVPGVEDRKQLDLEDWLRRQMGDDDGPETRP